jgi:hypothetical protein
VEDDRFDPLMVPVAGEWTGGVDRYRAITRWFLANYCLVAAQRSAKMAYSTSLTSSILFASTAHFFISEAGLVNVLRYGSPEMS